MQIDRASYRASYEDDDDTSYDKISFGLWNIGWGPTMDVLLKGLSISAKKRVTVTVLHDGKNDVTSMSLFGC